MRLTRTGPWRWIDGDPESLYRMDVHLALAVRRRRSGSPSSRPAAGSYVTGEAESPMPEHFTRPGWGNHTG